MKNENIVEKNEYDRYLIPLPFSKLLKNKKYLFSELEKRHPCFSNDYCFDSKLRLGKKGFLSDVVVMNKGKYASYRRKGGIHLEGLKLKRFREDFVFILFPFLSLCLVIFFIAGRVDFKKSDFIPLENNSTEEITAPGFVVESEKEISGYKGLMEDIFEAIEKSKGKLSILDWKIEGGKEYLSLQVKDMSPEIFFDFKDEESFYLSAVTYENKKSSFSFTCERAFPYLHNDNVRSEMKNVPFQKELRELLLREKCHLMEEKFFPYSIRCKISDFEIFKVLSDFLKLKNIAVKKIYLKEEASDYFLVDIFFDEEKNINSGLNLNLLKSYKELFLISEEVNEMCERPKKSKNTGHLLNESLKKIGEVRYTNGSKLIFYKDKNGKVVKRNEN